MMDIHPTWQWILGLLIPATVGLAIWRFAVIDKNAAEARAEAEKQRAKDREEAREERNTDRELLKDSVSAIRSDFKAAIEAQAKFFTDAIAQDRVFFQSLITGQQAQWEAAVSSIREQNEAIRIETQAMRTRYHDFMEKTYLWRQEHEKEEGTRWEHRDRTSAEYREKNTDRQGRLEKELAEVKGLAMRVDERSSLTNAMDLAAKISRLERKDN